MNEQKLTRHVCDVSTYEAAMISVPGKTSRSVGQSEQVGHYHHHQPPGAAAAPVATSQ